MSSIQIAWSSRSFGWKWTSQRFLGRARRSRGWPDGVTSVLSLSWRTPPPPPPTGWPPTITLHWLTPHHHHPCLALHSHMITWWMVGDAWPLRWRSVLVGSSSQLTTFQISKFVLDWQNNFQWLTEKTPYSCSSGWCSKGKNEHSTTFRFCEWKPRFV